jgi:hypothetical protein
MAFLVLGFDLVLGFGFRWDCVGLVVANPEHTSGSGHSWKICVFVGVDRKNDKEQWHNQ